MKNPRLTRREALRLGAKLATGAALAPALTSARLSAQAIRPRPRRDFDVRDYGVAADGKTLDTAVFQRAIDEAAAAGGGRVVVRGGKKYLISHLVLKSGVDFHLADDAELLISTKRGDYDNTDAVITAETAEGLRITGTGRINGRAKEFMLRYDDQDEWWLPMRWRPRLFQIVACRGLEFCDFTFGSAPAWGLHLLGCEHVLVDGIKIRNDLDVPNCDGIDPDHCRHVEIRNCDIICGDDGIVIKATRQPVDFGPSANIVVKDCVFETQDSALKIGTETTSDIHDIRIERCKIRSSCRSFTIQLRDEADVYNISVRDITFASRYHSDPWWGRGEAFSLTAIPRNQDTKVGKIHDVRLQNFTGRAENSGRVQGCAGSRPRDIRLENIALTLGRWSDYPGGIFDNRPTTAITAIEKHNTPGFSIRQADNVTLHKCGVEWGKNIPDYFTHALEAEDVSNLALTQFTGKAAHPGRDEAVIIR